MSMSSHEALLTGSIDIDPKYQCNICFDILKDACLTECCGQHYCNACLVKWDAKFKKKTCPQCREENFRHVRNKSLMREIHSHSGSNYTTSAAPPADSGQCIIFNASQKYSCVKCKVEPLRDPCLMECCGQHICHSCLTHWLWMQPRKVCPHCNKVNFTHILNRSLKREINETFIRCIHQMDGCQWMGRPEYLELHLNTSSGDCDYVEVYCPFKFCHRSFKRKSLEQHKRVCQHRREKCIHCGLEVSHSAINLHHDECPEYLLPCPNHCNPTERKRRDLKIHYLNCPLEPLDCPIRDAGCIARVARRDMESHIETNTQQHMMLLQQQNQSLQAQNWELWKTNRRLRKWNGELNTALERLGYLQ